MEQVENDDIMNRVIYTQVDDRGVFIDFLPPGTEIVGYRHTNKCELVALIRRIDNGIVQLYKMAPNRKSIVLIRGLTLIDCG